MNCKICNMLLDESIDCGGDCIFCMADAGDPECVKAVIAVARTSHALLRALDGVLKSAHPNKVEHPGMFKAWREAEPVLAAAQQKLKS